MSAETFFEYSFGQEKLVSKTQIFLPKKIFEM